MGHETREEWQVRQVFPYHSEADIKNALSRAKNNPDAAIALLYQEIAWYKHPFQWLSHKMDRHRAEDPGKGSSVKKVASPNAKPAPPASPPPSTPKRPPRLLPAPPKPAPEAPPTPAKVPKPPSRPNGGGAVPAELLVREREVARRLEAADVAPEDFFALNSRLMIATRRQVAYLTADSDITTKDARMVVGRDRLADRLKCLGLQEQVMAYDGNCQFRSFAFQLLGDAERHSSVRRHVITFMKANPKLYSDYFGGEGEFAEYLSNMARPTVWGDEMTLKGFCDAYSVTVHLVMSTGTRWYHQIKPHNCKADGRQIAVAYLSPVHYNAIIPLSNFPYV